MKCEEMTIRGRPVTKYVRGVRAYSPGRRTTYTTQTTYGVDFGNRTGSIYTRTKRDATEAIRMVDGCGGIVTGNLRRGASVVGLPLIRELFDDHHVVHLCDYSKPGRGGPAHYAMRLHNLRIALESNEDPDRTQQLQWTCSVDWGEFADGTASRSGLFDFLPSEDELRNL